jgi:hypothetical protein
VLKILGSLEDQRAQACLVDRAKGILAIACTGNAKAATELEK